ncbi:hypothetical protein FBZ87_104620 [Nitrospirillum amazonense]|uniref:Mobilization protein MobC n=1 Tax=Nitrospirillum amazonense TaxID=28077 RepID=A0A560JWM3_9PROT|nr:hypothetical protein [Nitrospirillum amazonense]TWB75512.1 hypothetical protein FBZ87_104620 [Nitrospirillum amazonense]
MARSQGWKSARVEFRIDEADRTELISAAAADGARGLSEWVRVVALAAARRHPVYSANELDVLAALREQIRSNGVLLNQMARRLNMLPHDDRAAGLAPELAEAIQRTNGLYDELDRTLKRGPR